MVYNIFMVLVGIVSAIFTIVGICFFLTGRYLKKNARQIPAKIWGYEKYTSVSGSGSNRTHQTYYRAIFQFSFQNQTRIFCGHGSHKLGSKIGASTKIFLLEDNPDQCFEASPVYEIFATVFTLFGLGAYSVYWFQMDSIVLKILPIGLLIVIPIFFVTFLKKKGLYQVFIKSLKKNNQLETEETLADPKRKIYRTQKELDREHQSQYKWAMGITLFFFTGISLGLYRAWQWMGPKRQKLFLDADTHYLKIIEALKTDQDPKIILFCALLFFFFLIFYSLIRVLSRR